VVASAGQYPRHRRRRPQPSDSGPDQPDDRGAAQAGQWESLPLISEGGIVDVLVMDPSDALVLYAGTPGGLFKSTDGAETWTQIWGPAGRVAEIAIDPASPSTVYVHVWPQGASLYFPLHRSDDGGVTWTKLTDDPVTSCTPVLTSCSTRPPLLRLSMRAISGPPIEARSGPSSVRVSRRLPPRQWYGQSLSAAAQQLREAVWGSLGFGGPLTDADTASL